MAVTISGSTPTVSAATGWAGGTITSGTAQASTSGTSIDFTSIPSWVKRVTVMLNGVSTNGSSIPQVQLGSGSVTTSGYLSAAWQGGASNVGVTSTTGFALNGSPSSSATLMGTLVLTNISGNTWVGTGSVAIQPTAASGGETLGGNVTLSGTLDRVRLTTVNGTDTFDAGSVNILYE